MERKWSNIETRSSKKHPAGPCLWPSVQPRLACRFLHGQPSMLPAKPKRAITSPLCSIPPPPPLRQGGVLEAVRWLGQKGCLRTWTWGEGWVANFFAHISMLYNWVAWGINEVFAPKRRGRAVSFFPSLDVSGFCHVFLKAFFQQYVFLQGLHTFLCIYKCCCSAYHDPLCENNGAEANTRNMAFDVINFWSRVVCSFPVCGKVFCQF